MTGAQIDAAMRRRCPVLCGGIRYDRITEDDSGQRLLSAVLLDQNGNCTVRVPAESVELDEDGG